MVGRKKGIMHDSRTAAAGMTWSYDDCGGSALLPTGCLKKIGNKKMRPKIKK